MLKIKQEMCEYCGPKCYEGAEHNARVEDGAKYKPPIADPVVGERSAEEVAKRLANAIQAFRNTPMLAKLTKLRATPQYGELCFAWEEHHFVTDSWIDRVESLTAALAACQADMDMASGFRENLRNENMQLEAALAEEKRMKEASSHGNLKAAKRWLYLRLNRFSKHGYSGSLPSFQSSYRTYDDFFGSGTPADSDSKVIDTSEVTLRFEEIADLIVKANAEIYARAEAAEAKVAELTQALALIRKACLQVIAMNIQEAHDRLGDRSAAESWACVRTLRDALKEKV